MANRAPPRKRPARPGSIGQLLQRCLPVGTATARDSWRSFPRWPPDLFAVAASLVQASGAYAIAMPSDDEGDPGHPFGSGFTDRVEALGLEWRQSMTNRALDQHLQKLWKMLLAEWTTPVECGDKLPGWAVAALELMVLSDEASAGIGLSNPDKDTPFAWLYLHLHWSPYLSGRPTNVGPRRTLPRAQNLVTACIEVPPDVACVQPKTRSPRVGCTMRSLSRHLAFLPPVTEIMSSWQMLPRPPQPGSDPLNLLLVPYPYQINGKSFVAARHDARGWGLFDIQQTWIPPRQPALHIARFIRGLIDEARKEVDEVDGVVLPELALPRDVALEVATRIADEQGLEFFISGTLSAESPPRNRVLGCVMQEGEFSAFWEQSKHHRWKLDRGQIATYSLGHVLDSNTSWWEHAAVGNREVRFFQVRDGACLAVLICEDLARIDPVQTVVRSVGPNLVLVLLMDGAQVKERWPARYATVLAEDPGCSVLTLTSLGMLMRGYDRLERPSRSVALWRDPSGPPRQLELQPGDHALLVTLSATTRQERTMDGRREKRGTVQFSLSGVRGVRLRDSVVLRDVVA
jgi:hypothetical protein